MKEAMEQVKEELGSDAVILHTKKYREGGIMGYKAKEVVEVTAAIEESNEDSRLKARAKRSLLPDNDKGAGSHLDVVSPASPVMPHTVLNQYKTNGTETGVRMAEAPIAAPSFQPLMPDKQNLVTAVEQPKEDAEVMSATEVSPAVQPMAVTSNPEDAEKIQKLEAELAQMKTLLTQVMSKDQPQDEVSLQEALRRQEVDEDILKDMAARTAAGDMLMDCLDKRAPEVLAEYLAG